MRQSAAEIDAAICDVAAGLFAVHGFDHTSVQQVADAVGYSKPGLLHRFGSKEALHRAVVDEVADTAERVVTVAQAQRGQPRQVAQVFELIALRALARPGIAHYMVRLFQPSTQVTVDGGLDTERVTEAGRRLADSLELPDSASTAALLRLDLALHLVVDAAVTQRSAAATDRHVPPETLVPMLVALAANVVGAPVGV